LLEIPRGLLDPLRCKYDKCTKTKPDKTKGNKKWKVKNRVRVGVSMQKPPQSQYTRLGPTKGSALKRLVITVAPQNLIWPQGRMYPKKAIAIDNSNKQIPTYQTSRDKNEP